MKAGKLVTNYFIACCRKVFKEMYLSVSRVIRKIEFIQHLMWRRVTLITKAKHNQVHRITLNVLITFCYLWISFCSVLFSTFIDTRILRMREVKLDSRTKLVILPVFVYSLKFFKLLVFYYNTSFWNLNRCLH